MALLSGKDGDWNPQGSSDTLILGQNNHLHLGTESIKLHLTLEAMELPVIGP